MKHIRPTTREFPAAATAYINPFWNLFFRAVDILIWLVGTFGPKM